MNIWLAANTKLLRSLLFRSKAGIANADIMLEGIGPQRGCKVDGRLQCTFQEIGLKALLGFTTNEDYEAHVVVQLTGVFLLTFLEVTLRQRTQLRARQAMVASQKTHSKQQDATLIIYTDTLEAQQSGFR